MKNLLRKNISKIILIFVILLQIIYTVYTFVYIKQGNHSDEGWIYGLANSSQGPIYSLQDGVELMNSGVSDIAHVNQWVPGASLREYLTVQPSERFSYGRVYYNLSLDLHPPVHAMLLHTVCSFFPDNFSWWYGLALNLLFLAVTQIFLFLTVEKIGGSQQAALAASILYAGSMGALCTFTFIRVYGLLTMECMIYVYFSTCFFMTVKREEKICKKPAVFAAVCACISFLTHYYGILFAGIFTSIFCVYLLIKSRFRHMFFYGFCMLAALGLFFVLYPSAWFDITSYSGPDIKLFSPAVEFRILLCQLFEYNYGFSISYFPTVFWNITIPLLVAALVATVMILFPFRHEAWFGSLMRCLKAIPGRVRVYLAGANYIPAFVLFSSWLLYEWVAYKVGVYQLNEYAMRYTMNTFPLIAVAVVIGIYTVLKHFVHNEKLAGIIIMILACIVVCRVQMTTEYPYSFPVYGDQTKLNDLTRDKNVVIIDGGTMNIFTEYGCFLPELYNAKEIFYTSADMIDQSVLDDVAGTQQVDYVIIAAKWYPFSEEDMQKVDEWMPFLNNTNEEQSEHDATMSAMQEAAATIAEEVIEQMEETADESMDVNAIGENSDAAEVVTDAAEYVDFMAVCKNALEIISGEGGYQLIAITKGQVNKYYCILEIQ